MKDLVVEESVGVLNFVSGKIRLLGRLTREPHLLQHKAENSAQHAYFTTVTALALHGLCKDKDISPYALIETGLLVWQCLLEDSQSGSLAVPPTVDRPEVTDAWTIVARANAAELFSDLPALSAQRVEHAWENQAFNPDNPVTRLVNISSLLCDVLHMCDEWITGNVRMTSVLSEKIAKLQGLINTEPPPEEGKTSLVQVVQPIIDRIIQVVGA